MLLELIDKIENQEERRKRLEEYLNVFKEKGPLEKRIKEKQTPYDVKEIMERIKTAKMPREPTIKELRQEINSVKTELQFLKERIVLLEVKNESPLIMEEAKKEEGEPVEINSLQFINRIDWL